MVVQKCEYTELYTEKYVKFYIMYILLQFFKLNNLYSKLEEMKNAIVTSYLTVFLFPTLAVL